jgi:hypothetical protein
MNTLPNTAYRALRWPFLCLITLGILLISDPELPINAQEKQADWRVTLDEGKTTPATLTLNSNCPNAQSFRIESKIKYVKFEGQTESIQVQPGGQIILRAKFDSTGLKKGVYQDKFDVKCITCQKTTPKCTQDRDTVTVELTVTKSSGPIVSTTGTNKPLKLPTGTTIGKVTSTDGAPIPGVRLQIKGKTVATTDRTGSYNFDSSKFKEDTVVTLSADGFIDNIRVLQGGTDALGPVSLAAIRDRVSFQAEKGGRFNFKGAVMNIPPSAFVDSKGKTVKGTVDLEFTLLDVTNRTDLAAAMGNFTGRMLDGKVQPLQSYGIFDWKVRNEKKEALKIAPGSKVGLSVSIPPKLVKEAPQRMGIFTIDRNTAVWQQDGWFQLQPETLTYEGTVTNTDGSNLDTPSLLTCITVQVVSLSWNGGTDAGFHVDADGTGYRSSGTTDSSGRVCLMVKKGDSISISAGRSIYKSNWGTPVATQMIASMIDSGTANCGDPVLCPIVVVEVDLIVGGDH